MATATAPSPRDAGTGDDPLDNAVWHALHGGHADLAERRGRAARYPGAVSVFAALPDRPDPAAWHDLAALAGAGGPAVLFRGRVDPPAGWVAEHVLPGVQLVAPAGIGRPDPEVVAPSPADRAEATALVRATRPGPWRPRTIELGRYVGLRHDGRLVALAGERLRPTGHVEISAVCTDPEVRGRGLASRLVLHLVAAIEADGAVPFLHTSADNVTALRLYERLGFARSREVTAVALRAPGAAA
jgi:ribosomal protein S18 acetylase RimI-like enzyme